MKYLFAIIFVLSCWVCTMAQPAPSDDHNTPETDKKSSKQSPQKQEKKNNSPYARFNLPPEKLSPIRVAHFSQSPVIDGKLDDEMWKSAQVLKDFFQTNPGDNIPASKPTEVMIGYDEKFLYFAFRCYDERDKIRATVAKRDEVFNEDNVRIWLDTYNDQRRAYIIGFNPLGIQQDGIYTENKGADYSVDIVMESKGVIEDWGWSVEAKIPFKSLRYTAGKGKLWGFNAARNIDRLNDEFDSWMPDDRNVSGTLIKHGKLSGLEGIKTERTLEIVPTVTVSEAGNRVRTVPRYLVNENTVDPGRFVNQPINQDLGVTVKLGITPNVTLDAAVNPDFAEVEADAPVVTANQRFPIFFTEKRPFFLEGAEIFQSPLNVFYSRTIVDPDAAAKLSGKIGKNSFGLLVATDKAPGNYGEDDRNDPSVRPRINEFLDKNALFGVVRLKHDVGRENNVGFFGTYRSFPEQKNLLGGFDGRFKLNASTVMQFQAVGTHSRRCFFNSSFDPLANPAQAQRNREICDRSTYNQYRTGNGLGYTWNIDHTEKNRGWYIEATGRTKDYRADAGFTRRVNSNSLNASNRLSTEPRPKAKLIRVDWRQNANYTYDWSGRTQSAELGTSVDFTLQNNTYLNFETGVSLEKLYEEEFGLKRLATRSGTFSGDPIRSTWQNYVSGNIDKQINKRANVSAFVGYINNAFDLDFGGGDRYPRISPSALSGDGRQDPGPGRQYDIELSTSLRPVDPLRVSVSFQKSHLVRNDTGKTAFDSNIVTLRSTYQFTRFTFIRARWDYDTLNSNASGQFLAGWNPNPGTAIYIGYNDNFNYNGFNPYSGQLEPRFERNNRSFFIRASYLIRRSF